MKVHEMLDFILCFYLITVTVWLVLKCADQIKQNDKDIIWLEETLYDPLTMCLSVLNCIKCSVSRHLCRQIYSSPRDIGTYSISVKSYI